MHVFSVKDVERVLKIPRSAIRTLIRGGFVAPARGHRRQYEFSFQDLIALRMARALMLARVSPRRISQALRQLRRSVPHDPKVGNLRICASGTELVVRDERGPWRTPSGQYLLEFDVNVSDGSVQILDRPAAKRRTDPDALFERAAALEDCDIEAALRTYQECVEADAGHVAARINCGRLLHAAGDFVAAEALYRAGLARGDEDPNLWFNLALVLEDTKRELEAVCAYQRALALDPAFADAHFNLARLYQQLDMPRAAIRHWNWYRRLTLSPE